MLSDIEESDDKQLFLNIISRMLRWLPEDRDTMERLLPDPWFQE